MTQPKLSVRSTIKLLTHCRSGHGACNDHTVNNGKDETIFEAVVVGFHAFQVL